MLLLLLPCLLGPSAALGQSCAQQVEHSRLEMEAQLVQVEVRLREELVAIKDEMEETCASMSELARVEEGLRSAVASSLRDLPQVMVCAYKEELYPHVGTVTYDRITSEYNNAARPRGGDGSMDITTGTFTALTAGHYTVTYSAMAEVQGAGSHSAVSIYAFLNGGRVEESRWQSRQFGPHGEEQETWDQGSRTVVSLSHVAPCLTLSTPGLPRSCTCWLETL
jgi:hypothetical protein